LIRLKNVAPIVQICHPGVPAFAGGMPARIAAHCREGLIRLKNVAPIVQICHPGVPAFAGGMPARIAAHCRERPIRLKPGLPIRDVRINISKFISWYNQRFDFRLSF
jgi:hypothetical protein